MKKLILPTLFLMLAIISCQKEITFETADGGTGSGGSGGGSGGGTGSACKACVYLPMCDGTIYNYYDTAFGGSPTVTADTLQFVKDTSFGGRTNQKFLTKGSATPYFTNCTSGVSRITVFNAATSGGTLTKFELRMLDANLAVNGIWNDTVQNGAGQTVLYKNVIKAKAVSRTLHTNTFTDVIHVQTEAGVEVPLLGFFITNRSDYYYARGVGLVEALIANEDGSLIYQHKVIKAYRIP